MTETGPLSPVLPDSPDVQALLELHGIIPDFINYAGEQQEIPHGDRLAVLGLMGVELHADSDVHRILNDCQEQARGHWLPAATVVPCNTGTTLNLSLLRHELQCSFTWSMITEPGERLAGSFVPDQLDQVARFETAGDWGSIRKLVLPALPAGYHRLTLDAGESRDFLIIAAPARCYEPDWMIAGRRLAGMSLHLYELRSSRNWGIGDFTDLRTFVANSAGAGLDFIVLNPLHVLDSLAPQNCSPYSPVDRRFLNPLYIDIESESDFIESDEVRAHVDEPDFQSRLRTLRETDLVDYEKVSRLKHTVLLRMFHRFRVQHLDESSSRGLAFNHWVSRKGEVLVRFGEFQARRSRASVPEAADPRFHYYLQWLADAQLQACQLEAQQAGMAIGLVRDIAVGSDRNGAEVCLNPTVFCELASVGAPPDPFAPQGQNWGLPPMNPLALRQTGFAHFIELLQDNMRHCGALRIDHIMSLMRLWWCPERQPCAGEPGQEGSRRHTGQGAYVKYPADDLFAILRLESLRQKCVVIGEDLGIVPPEIRHLMWDSSVFSNLLFYFEKRDAVYFRHPRNWNPRSLAMVANHDVPTLAAWWSKSDLALRSEIGLFESPDELNSAISARESDLIQTLHLLNELDLLPENWQDFNIHRRFDAALCTAILQANAGSASQLVSLQPEDLCLVEKPINIPGTSKEYPNWQRKLPVTVEQLFDSPERKNMLSEFVSARVSG